MRLLHMRNSKVADGLKSSPCAADQGNLALLKLICDSAEGRTFHGVNEGASKSQAPLMRACSHGCGPVPAT